MKKIAVCLLLLPCLLPPTAGAKAGRLDRSFGGDGKVTSGFQRFRRGGFGAPLLALTPSWKIVAADGRTLYEFLPSGSPNRRFGDEGKVQVEPPADTREFRDMAVDSRGRVLILGSVATSPTSTSALLMRYLPDGSPDPTFGQSGTLVTDLGLPLPVDETSPPGYPSQPPPLPFPSISPSGLAVDSSDRPILTGAWVSERHWCYMLSYTGKGTGFIARLRSDGSLDSSFDGDGVVVDSPAEYESPPLVDGTGLLAFRTGEGCRPTGYDPPTISRFTEAGALDSAFGSGGVLELPLSGSPEAAQDRFGRIVLLGYGKGAGTLFRLMRLTPRGSIDHRFGGGEGPFLSLDVGPDLAVDDAGRPVIASQVGSPRKGWKFALTRRRSDGRLDPGFGRRGWVKTAFPGSALPFAIEIDDAGRILVAGSMKQNGRFSIALARYLSR